MPIQCYDLTDNLRDRGSELDYSLGSDSEESEGGEENEIEDFIVNSLRKCLLGLEFDFEKEGRPTNSQLIDINDLCDSNDIIPASDDKNGPRPSTFSFIGLIKKNPFVFNEGERPEPNPRPIRDTIYYPNCFQQVYCYTSINYYLRKDCVL